MNRKMVGIRDGAKAGRKGSLGKAGGRGKPQVSNLGECVNGESSIYAEAGGSRVVSLFGDLLGLRP